MPKILFVEADGTEHEVEVALGVSAMEGAVQNSVPGIDGDCGGQAACATCHVFVDSGWLAKTGTAEPVTERPMLELAEGAEDNSRLACQIIMTDELDGLVLRMPAQQF
ncbi:MULTISPECIES: 2Fe-2S iron-sulfur cluster-binding protein [unclassified Sphingobium]|uniref:2Fe-2S iron-sulfur cluster-binding protein n=1 Tax=unclassified Sphingobium TaxID=2611147 RepID=UPI0035A65DE7